MFNQNASRLRLRRVRYDRRWVCQACFALAAAVLSDLFAAAAAARSSRRVRRLAVRHSSSNHGSAEVRGRRVTIRTGMRRSSMAVNTLYHRVMPSCLSRNLANRPAGKGRTTTVLTGSCRCPVVANDGGRTSRRLAQGDQTRRTTAAVRGLTVQRRQP